jgi:hypothetical protein
MSCPRAVSGVPWQHRPGAGPVTVVNVMTGPREADRRRVASFFTNDVIVVSRGRLVGYGGLADVVHCHFGVRRLGHVCDAALVGADEVARCVTVAALARTR